MFTRKSRPERPRLHSSFISFSVFLKSPVLNGHYDINRIPFNSARTRHSQKNYSGWTRHTIPVCRHTPTETTLVRHYSRNLPILLIYLGPISRALAQGFQHHTPLPLPGTKPDALCTHWACSASSG